MTQSDQETACPAAIAGGFEARFAELVRLLAPVFFRSDLRSNAEAYVRVLLKPGVSGNCWALAQAVGHERPYRLQHLLSGAVWDEDAARDVVRSFVARHLGDGGVLIFDGTGDLKKGVATAATGRQYTGTAGRIENAIVAVYASYAKAHGHALVDRELYVQAEWFTDPDRMRAAGFDERHAFATTGQIAGDQAQRVLGGGLRPAWAAGDEVYGRSSELRSLFEQRGIGYVFAVGSDFRITTSGHVKMRADQAIGLAEPHGWNRRSRGNGSKGRRLYYWAWIATISPRHQLLVRRKISDPRELAYYIAYVPDHCVCSLTDLVKVAGARWAIEDDFQDAKQSVALDQTQVRGYRAWKRHTALALAAYALLAVASALAKAAHPRPVLSEDPDQQAPADCGMTAPAVPEIQRLLTTTRRTPVNQHNEFHVAWSDWRRRHRARVRWHRYRTRLALTARPSVKRAAHRKAGTSGKIVEARRSGRCIVDDVNAGMGAGTDERQFGPWDVSEAGDRGNEKFRLALGGLVIRGVPGMTVKLEIHDARAIAVTLVLGDSLMQLQAYTALAISSRWRTVRAEILENLRQVVVAADEVRGCLGDEVIAYGVAGDTAYPARFVGYDGPGWLLRGVFRGPAALDQDVADTFERLFRDTIVVPDGQSRAERSVFVLRPPNVDRPIGPPRPPLRWVGGED